jgi:ribosomal protein S18 acetylase RimI-like enzyme
MNLEKQNLIIRSAEIKDFLWIKKNDHITENILQDKIENREIYIVEEKGKLIGWLRFNLFWDTIPFMNMLYLLEEYRNIGIGKKLVNYWEEEMKTKGYKTVLTSTQSDESGQHFYRKIGYTEIGGFKYLEDPFEIIFIKKIG